MKFIAGIISILTGCFVFGQSSQAVTLSVEPRSVDVGETVIIEVKTTVYGDLDIDNLPSCFVMGQNMTESMSTKIDHNTGKVINYYELRRTGAFAKAGKYTIGPAWINQGNKSYKSNTVVITVGDKTDMISSDITNQQLKEPAFGVIQTSKSVLYEGEPVLVSAKVYTHFNPTYLERYVPYNMKGAIDKHPVGNSNVTKTSMEQFRGMNLFTFEYDRNVIFPVGTGDFKIRSYSMSVYDDYRPFNLTSSSATITIKPLPSNAPADFIGAVGHFDIERFVEDNNLKQGDVFKLRIVISGTGNLQNILEPRPELPKGFVIYGDPQIEENFSYTSRGAEGSISYEYNIQVSAHGDLTLPPTSISYFDVEDEKYVTVKTSEHTMTVERDKNFVVQEIEEDNTASTEKTDELANLRKADYYTSGDGLYGSVIFWAGVGVPFAAAFVLLLFGKRREKSEAEIAERRQLRVKEQEIRDDIARLKLIVAKGEHMSAFSGIESVLRKAVEHKLRKSETPLSRQQLFEFAANSGISGFEDRVRQLLQQCDQQRYGFGTSGESAGQALNDLLAILEQLDTI